MKPIFGALCGIAFTGLVATPSTATTVTLDVLGLPFSTPASAQIDGVEVEPRGSNQFDTGGFLVANVNTMEQFIAWCIEVSVIIDMDPTEYDTDVPGLAPAQETLISQLYTGYIGETNTDVGSAAFQLAIWEIVEEPADSIADLTVTEGRFTAGSTTANVVETANTFLAGLGNFDANYRINYFRSADSQDLISATPVPVPASILFLGAGVGAMAIARRRKTAKTATA